jgi:hypothetical protein
MDDAAPAPAAPSHANTNDPPAGLDFVESHASALSELAAAITTPSGSAGALAQPKPGAEDGGQALESHEVVELQAFNERKDWIISKTKVRSSSSSGLRGALKMGHRCSRPCPKSTFSQGSTSSANPSLSWHCLLERNCRGG